MSVCVMTVALYANGALYHSRTTADEQLDFRSQTGLRQARILRLLPSQH